MTDPVTQKAEIGVGAVGAVRDVPFPKVILNLGSGDVQQRADEQPVFDGHPAETGCPCAAEESHQDRLRLIVSMVSKCYGVRPRFFRKVAKPLVPGIPSGFLQGNPDSPAPFANVDPVEFEWQTIRSCNFSYEISVPVRFSSSQHMVDVRHDELQSHAELLQDVEQRKGIGPSGYGYNNPGLVGKQAVICNRFCRLLQD
jgi:hypothetical protein